MRRVESPSGAHMVVDGQPLLNFGGSCYLGLSRQAEMVAAATTALQAQGSASQIPRHYGFALTANLEVEEAATAFFGTEAAMYFSTGYLFGQLALTGLAPHFDRAFLDESAHYSLRDGAALAGRPVHFFRHRDPRALAEAMQQSLRPGERPLVATDGMFATFGAIAPLAEYARLLEPYDGWLVVDESHSFGVVGPTGRGAIERAGLSGNRKTVAGGSMCKAFCAFGGIAVGTRSVIDDLWRTPAARGAISGMSAGAAMASASLSYVRQHPEVLDKLRGNVRRLKEGLNAMSLDVERTEAPVATFVDGNASHMRALQERLLEEGIFVIYSNYVGAGADGAIRCAAFADHEPEDIDRLLDALARNRSR